MIADRIINLSQFAGPCTFLWTARAPRSQVLSTILFKPFAQCLSPTPSTITAGARGLGITVQFMRIFPCTASTGVYCHTEHVVHRPPAVAVAQRVCDPILRSAEVVGFGFVEGQGLWLASPACFVVGMQVLFLCARALCFGT